MREQHFIQKCPLTWQLIDSGLVAVREDKCCAFSITGDIQELYETKIRPGHAAAFSDDCDSASAKGIVRGAGNQVGKICRIFV